MKTVLHRKIRRSPRDQGAAAVLAMMFLVIFGSLAAAMAIVSQGNLRTADSHLKINRSLAASETGMQFMIYRLNQVTTGITTDKGLIDATIVADENLWGQARTALLDSLAADDQYDGLTFEVDADSGALIIPAIEVGPAAPQFSATFTPHPLPGEDYDSGYYDRPPYSNMSPAVSAAAPLDGTWVRVKVSALDGTGGSQVGRSIAMDFQITKKIPYALLSRSRVMIGRNVMIDGPIGSRFMEVNLPNGHPVQMESDFLGLHPDLDDDLAALVGSIIGDDTYHDTDGDNRIDIHNPVELGDLDADALDVNSDGYIDGYDFFVDHFDASGEGDISQTELENGLDSGMGTIYATQLLELIDTFGNPDRAGYNDGVINHLDRYAKIRGEIYISADVYDWNDGAADPDGDGDGAYQDYFQGPIHPDFLKSPLSFNASENGTYQFGPQDFDVSTYADMADGDLAAQASDQAGTNPDLEPDLPIYDSEGVTESVPFGAAHPYDYYDRPVYKNMQFTNVRIPRGTNALFENCHFLGVVYIESEVDNTDPNYNYAGMQEADGSDKHPDRSVTIDGTEYTSTKDISNNVRFHNCTFDGGIVTVATNEFTHTRNKISFTGATQFKDMSKSVVDDSESGSTLTADERKLYSRSSILAPHYSVELGTFVAPGDSNETVRLQGTIVGGVLDMRGQVKVDGTILTTFMPQSDTGPVLGDTSPQFNTTLGYFSSAAGDLEAELPPNGMGVIQVVYDPTRPLPDGITGPIVIEPNVATYFEGHY